MKIASSEVSLASERSYAEENSLTENLTVRVGNRISTLSNSAASSAEVARDSVSISAQGNLLGKSLVQGTDGAVSGGDGGEAVASEGRSADLLQLLIEALTGKKINLMSYAASNSTNVAEVQSAEVSQGSGGQASAGWGVSYDYQSSHYERETTEFSAEGIIKTSDGKEISFSVNLKMDREFMSQESISLRAGDAVKVDPLVINFDGSAAELTDTKFAFDLDSDGESEDVSFVASGSGFLVLDKNRDGEVNDGGELFGPESGNGFSDLAAYDSDENGWIDENDAVYDRLQVWTKDSEGNDTLSSLQSMGVGAIYLGSSETEFALNDGGGEANGQVSRTGIYVEESGAVKTIQQVDLNV